MKARTFLFAVFTLFIAATSASAFTPVTGTWWNANESGSGYNIEIHRGVLVITIYSYKSDGDSEWYLSSGPMSADQRQFTGTLDKYRNGQCISCTYKAATLIGNDGTISINFITETTATLTLPGGRVTSIQTFFPPTTSLDGTYRLTRTTVDFLGGALLDTAAGNIQASGTMVIAGNQITQSISVTANGGTSSFSISGTFTDYGSYIVAVVQGGGSSRIPMIVRGGSLVITESINAAQSPVPAFTEVDQWSFASSGTAVPTSEGRAVAKGGQIELGRIDAPLGGAIGAALMTATPPR